MKKTKTKLKTNQKTRKTKWEHKRTDETTRSMQEKDKGRKWKVKQETKKQVMADEASFRSYASLIIHQKCIYKPSQQAENTSVHISVCESVAVVTTMFCFLITD